MAVRKALVHIGGGIQEMPAGDTLEGAGGVGALNLYTVEVNLAAVARRSGRFTITTTAAQAVGSPALVTQAVGPYTGKGTRADEAEMHQVKVSASVTGPNTISCYWTSDTPVRGNVKFNYLIGVNAGGA